LRLERLYRFLYEDVVNAFNEPSRKAQIKLFDMNYENFKEDVHSFPRIMVSKSEGLFYIAITLVLCFLIVFSIFF